MSYCYKTLRWDDTTIAHAWRWRRLNCIIKLRVNGWMILSWHILRDVFDNIDNKLTILKLCGGEFYILFIYVCLYIYRHTQLHCTQGSSWLHHFRSFFFLSIYQNSPWVYTMLINLVHMLVLVTYVDASN